MKQDPTPPGLPTGNPLSNVLVIVLGTLALGVSLILGFFAFVVVACIVAILGSVIGIRLWWFKRRLARQGGGNTRPFGSGEPEAIEGEYEVVADDRDDA